MTVYMTFNEACDQLFNACDELLTESAVAEVSENADKKPEIFAKIKKILTKIWDFIIQVLRKIMSKFDKISYVKLTEDLEVPKCALHPNTKFIGMVMRALDSKTEKFNLDEFEKCFNNMMTDTIKFEKGKILNAKVIFDTCNQYKDWAEKCRKLADKIQNPGYETFNYNRVDLGERLNIKYDFNTRITYVSKKANEVVAKLSEIAKYSDTALEENTEKAVVAKLSKIAKYNETALKKNTVNHDSATYFSDLTAKLLAEATELVEPEEDDKDSVIVENVVITF